MCVGYWDDFFVETFHIAVKYVQKKKKERTELNNFVLFLYCLTDFDGGMVKQKQTKIKRGKF